VPANVMKNLIPQISSDLKKTLNVFLVRSIVEKVTENHYPIFTLTRICNDLIFISESNRYFIVGS